MKKKNENSFCYSLQRTRLSARATFVCWKLFCDYQEYFYRIDIGQWAIGHALFNVCNVFQATDKGFQ